MFNFVSSSVPHAEVSSTALSPDSLEHRGAAEVPQLAQSFVQLRRGHNVAFLAVSSMLLCCVALAGFFSASGNSEIWPQAIVGSVLSWFVVFSLASWRNLGTLYLFSLFFLLILAVFHLSHLFVHVLGIETFEFLTESDDATWHQKGGWCILLAFAAFGVGAALGDGAGAFGRTARSKVATAKIQKKTYWFGIGLLLASLAAVVLLLATVGNIFVFSRADLFRGVGDTRGFGLALMILPSAVLLLLAGADTKPRQYRVLVLGALLGLFVLFLGYRSAVLFPAVIGVVLWVKAGRRIPLWLVVGGLLFLMFVIPAVKYLRLAGSYNELGVDDIGKSLDQSRGAEEVFLELGGTAFIVSKTLEWVPNEADFRWGSSYLKTIPDSLPNLGLNISRGERKALASGSIKASDAQGLRPADWFIYKTNKWKFKKGQGSGFSAVAEAYLNFGLLGVFSVFLIFGYLLRRLDHTPLFPSAAITLCMCVTIWPLFKTIRNDFSNFTKPVVFTLIIIGLWQLVTFWKRHTVSRSSSRFLNDRAGL